MQHAHLSPASRAYSARIITFNELRLVELLDWFQRTKGEAYPRVGLLARMLGVTSMSIRNWRRSLERKFGAWVESRWRWDPERNSWRQRSNLYLVDRLVAAIGAALGAGFRGRFRPLVTTIRESEVATGLLDGPKALAGRRALAAPAHVLQRIQALWLEKVERKRSGGRRDIF